jgi:mono/diheme cytochrome c family protein
MGIRMKFVFAMFRLLFPGVFLIAAGLVPASAQFTPEQKRLLPAPAGRAIDFGADVAPIVRASCINCHGKGRTKGGFSLETRESLLKGGDSGPVVVPGQSAESHLIELVSGLDPDNVMPQKGSKLTPEQVGLLRAWIDQGLPWDAKVTFAKPPPRNLHPRQPALPPARPGLSHPVDRLLASYFESNNVRPAPPVEDRIYARRVYLDVIGMLPSAEELAAFEADAHPDKRDRLVERLLADQRRYAEHWLTFWNDLLRNDYRGTGYIDGGRKQISTWLYGALATNMSYREFVAKLIDPVPESEGFIKGIVWRGVVNASQKPAMQAAQNISQVFLGVNLKCASCHDSFINDWALADAYGMASVYAGENLEMYRCDKPTGRKAGPKFLYPELGSIPAEASEPERRKRLAEIMTSPENGRLTRTIVNRLWRHFMGRGLVEPVDDMEQPAWNPDLLDWLAEDLAGHGYDLKETMKQILTSRAYQMPAVSVPEHKQSDYVFNGPAIRRMSAEQFRDALGALTGVWFDKPAAKFDFALAEERPGSEPVLSAVPHWIWNHPGAAQKAAAERVYWRKTFNLDKLPEEAMAVAVCDNSFTLYLNGKKMVSGQDYQTPNFADLLPQLRAGENVLAVEAVNHTPNNKPPSRDQPPNEADANPAGLLVYVRLRGPDGVKDFATDRSWLWSRHPGRDWVAPGYEAADWQPAFEVGTAEAGPWSLGGKLEQAMDTALIHGGNVRASLVPADPLMLAMGRPPREQLLTTRTSTATTLEALEFSNGETLNQILQKGADHLLSERKESSSDLVRHLFGEALGRPPTAAELNLARDLVGDPVRHEGVEDLLWSVAMLPEFQLIY